MQQQGMLPPMGSQMGPSGMIGACVHVHVCVRLRVLREHIQGPSGMIGVCARMCVCTGQGTLLHDWCAIVRVCVRMRVHMKCLVSVRYR